MHFVTRMYLGRAIPAGASPAEGTYERDDFVKGSRSVKPEAFDAFVNNVVATTFPDGFTLIPVNGGWRDTTNGTSIKEPSTILEVYHSGSTPMRRKIKDVAVTYRQRFGQDAVMISTQNLSEGVQFV